MPKNGILIIKLIYFLSLYWLYQEFNDHGGWHKIEVLAISNFINKASKRGAKKIENLIKMYGDEINGKKDIYYIKDIMIIKTGDCYNNGRYEPSGYTINGEKIHFYRIIFWDFATALLHKDIGKYLLCYIAALILFIGQLVLLFK